MPEVDILLLLRSGPVVRIGAVGADIGSCIADNLALAAAFLTARRTQFVLVGGCALRLHGYDHVPADLDVVPEPSLANLRRLLDALAALGIVGRDRRPTDRALATCDLVTRTTPVGSVDVLLATGRREHAALARTAISMFVHGQPVRVAAIDDVLRLRALARGTPIHV